MARTRAGLVLRATQADREMATAFGIPVERVYALTFGLGAGLAALAAVLIVPIRQAHYLMGGDALLLSVSLEEGLTLEETLGGEVLDLGIGPDPWDELTALIR